VTHGVTLSRDDAAGSVEARLMKMSPHMVREGAREGVIVWR